MKSKLLFYRTLDGMTELLCRSNYT